MLAGNCMRNYGTTNNTPAHQAPPVWRAPEGLEDPTAAQVGGGRAWPGSTQTHRPIGGRREACGAWPRCRWAAAGPGCGTRGRWRGQAEQRAEAPNEARSADGSRAGRRPPAHTAAGPAARNTSGLPNNKTPEPEAVPGSGGGGWGIRTPEGLHPTRFPSVRHRPLGESSVHIVPDNHKQETPLSANPSQWSRSQMGVRAFTRRR